MSIFIASGSKSVNSNASVVLLRDDKRILLDKHISSYNKRKVSVKLNILSNV